MSCLAKTTAGTRRKLNQTLFGVFCTALVILSASSIDEASGFSQSTIFPASAAATAIVECSALGTAISTASISFLAMIFCQSVSISFQPQREAVFSSFDGVRPQITLQQTS